MISNRPAMAPLQVARARTGATVVGAHSARCVQDGAHAWEDDLMSTAPESFSVVESPVGASVRLAARPAYLKTADPMPMLRPPDLVDAAEVGVVVALKPLDQRAVRFRRGTFLVAAAELVPADQQPA